MGDAACAPLLDCKHRVSRSTGSSCGATRYAIVSAQPVLLDATVVVLCLTHKQAKNDKKYKKEGVHLISQKDLRSPVLVYKHEKEETETKGNRR